MKCTAVAQDHNIIFKGNNQSLFIFFLGCIIKDFVTRLPSSWKN